MRSKAFYSVKMWANRSYFLQGMDRRYEKATPTITAKYVRADKVASLTGKLMPFENRSNLSVHPGKEIKVTNVGRKSAALYVPARAADTEI